MTSRSIETSGDRKPNCRNRRTSWSSVTSTSVSTASRNHGRTGSTRIQTTSRIRTKPVSRRFWTPGKVKYEVRKPKGPGWAARKHQLEAVERWYLHGWSRLDGRLRSSIVEGIVVFLSLFDDSPAVHRAFCPPRSAYTEDPPAGEPKPLAAIDSLLESGKVLALNFPVGMNPGLARILGIMQKLDFQRAILQRIPQITASPKRIWRDLLFVCDEYHAFATVGEVDPTGDERTFALSRQAKLIPIVATQSISSLRSALPGDESWRTLLQCFRTKLFLATKIGRAHV